MVSSSSLRNSVLSPSRVGEAFAEKYVMQDDQVFIVTAVYGRLLICSPVDPEDQALPNTKIIEMKDGMVVYDQHPALVQVEEKPEATTITPREFACAVYMLSKDENLDIDASDIARYLQYPESVVRKRAAALMRAVPNNLIISRRRGRVNTYSVENGYYLSQWLNGNTN